ncbi:Protein cbp3, mitochondrial [Rhodotorula mucilaginosa]|uniref:Protein cbp3, mitochondrial n=1 Tax=Rhodotorula mucilaginosa TaxID=5537 RepID=A0A9P6WAU7_RHOMI|nr:Protein cbp3, mitochondrial [Rhodotorula mucilaginosa]
MPVPVARTALRAASQAARPARVSLAVARSYASSSNSPPASTTTTTSPAASTSAAAASTSASSAAGASSLPSSGAARPSVAPQPTNLPGSNLPSPSSASRYSPLTVSIVTKLAKLFGYHSQTSTAIRTTSDYYDRCAERGEIEAPFFYEECSLPPSFQTWFSLTTLHVWLLTVRFRSLPAPMGRTYIQELINHMFIDVELRMRGPYAVTQGRLIKGYMKDLLEQYHGACAAYDEGLIRGDAVLAAAVWRNLFGGGWAGVGGVKGKRAPKAGEAPKLGPNPIQVERNGQVDALSQSSSPSSSESATATATDASLLVDPMQAKLLKKGQSATDVFETDEPIVDPSRAEWTPLYPDDPDLEFAQSLEKLVVYIRKEIQRLERLSDNTVMQGKPDRGRGSLVDFSRIE